MQALVPRSPRGCAKPFGVGLGSGSSQEKGQTLNFHHERLFRALCLGFESGVFVVQIVVVSPGQRTGLMGGNVEIIVGNLKILVGRDIIVAMRAQVLPPWMDSLIFLRKTAQATQDQPPHHRKPAEYDP
jgi:hypothetical protein